MKTLENILAEWDAEVNETDPKFALKHALRLQGLFLNEDNEITNANGRPYATLSAVEWKDNTTLLAEIKLAGEVSYVFITIDTGKL